MDSQRKKLTNAYYWLRNLVPYIVFLLIITSCALIPAPPGHSQPHIEKRIDVPFQPFRVEQWCINTPPIFSVWLFHQAANALSDRVDGSINVNIAGEAFYAGLITHNSIGGTVWSLKVENFPADPPSLPLPKLGNDPYANAQAQSDYKKAFAAWQAQLIAQHQHLARLRAEVKQETDKLRSFVPPYDNIADDLYGCLVDASQHFQNVNGDKYLFIASPLVNNTLVNESSSISLSGVNVRVVYRTCSVASVCSTSDAYWSNIFKQYGARSVKILDPAQSEVEKPSF